MKRLSFCVWMAIVVPTAIPQETKPVDERMHVYAQMPAPKGAALTATSIEREAPSLKWSPGLIRLKGNVEIKTAIPVAPSKKTGGQRFLYMFVHADSAEYHEDTGAIDAHGDVHVTFEPR